MGAVARGSVTRSSLGRLRAPLPRLLRVTSTSTVELDLDDRWAYGPGTQHGGFLLQTVAGAAVTEQHPHPLAVTSHFLAPPGMGPAQVELETLRAGRSTSVVRARLVQSGRTCLDVVVTAGRLGEPGAPAYDVTVPPELPPVADCPRNGAAPGQERNGITEQLEVRLDPAAAGWLGAPTAPNPTRSGCSALPTHCRR